MREGKECMALVYDIPGKADTIESCVALGLYTDYTAQEQGGSP